MRIRIASKFSNDWNKAQDLVNEKYKRTFGADVLPNPDYFVVCVLPSEESDSDTQIVACAGLTLTSTAPLFSEQYLDEPIEQLISRLEGKSVSRNAIVEIGSLASRKNEIGIELVEILSIIIWCLGKRYVLCTATKQLRRILSSLNLLFEPIQLSDYQRLGENVKEKWGKYYDKQPATGYMNVCKNSYSLFSNHAGRSNLNVEVNLKKREMEEQYCEVH